MNIKNTALALLLVTGVVSCAPQFATKEEIYVALDAACKQVSSGQAGKNSETFATLVALRDAARSSEVESFLTDEIRLKLDEISAFIQEHTKPESENTTATTEEVQQEVSETNKSTALMVVPDNNPAHNPELMNAITQNQ